MHQKESRVPYSNRPWEHLASESPPWPSTLGDEVASSFHAAHSPLGLRQSLILCWMNRSGIASRNGTGRASSRGGGPSPLCNCPYFYPSVIQYSVSKGSCICNVMFAKLSGLLQAEVFLVICVWERPRWPVQTMEERGMSKG